MPGNISLQVEAVKPDGSRVPMIRLNTRADWDRRYWFEKPMTLPRGTRVEVTANLQDPDMLSAAFTSTPGAAAAPARATADAPDAQRRPRPIEADRAIALDRCSAPSGPSRQAGLKACTTSEWKP